ncbi:hypothetical protein QQF64_023581 [Cirrhinus molitorella]|uniref:ribonuclease H n=1 Tax=Cirrhinus molitorella TaxID=172907 RepID=A0ABR3NJQ3_9TELE
MSHGLLERRTKREAMPGSEEEHVQRKTGSTACVGEAALEGREDMSHGLLERRTKREAMPGREEEHPQGPCYDDAIFMGGPWVQKCNGTDSEVTFGAWKEQVQSMLTLQGLSVGQQLDLWAPSTPVFTQNVAVEPAADWKQTFRCELMQEVKEQFNEMSKAFFEELRQSRPSVNYPRDEPYLGQASRHQRAHNRPMNDRFKWDAQGRPVCNGCGECLVDTGSQVTIFTESLCRELFQNKTVGEVGDVPWLTLRAANGLDIPHVGYILADFEVEGASVLARGIVIVRDGCLGTNQALLGMNVISACWEEVCQSHQRTVSTRVKPQKQDWGNVLADCCRIRAAEAQKQRSDVARLSCHYAVTIPAQSEALVWAKLPNLFMYQQEDVLVEPHAELSGIEVARSISVVQCGRVPVRVRNLRSIPVTLYRNQKLAEMLIIDSQQVRGQWDLALVEREGGVVEVRVVQVEQNVIQSQGELPEYLKVASMGGEELDDCQRKQLEQFFSKWQHVFAAHEEDYGCTSVVRHQIPTADAAPIRERCRLVPPSLYKEIRGLLQGMLEGGIIRESFSPWATPIVLVQKKSGAWRFCVDYRKLNSVTKKDAFPLPRIEDSLTSLTRAEWYSTLDLAGGYWQVRLDEKDREKTAFTTPFGLFDWERMPFGLCNGPATFRRLMQRFKWPLDRIHFGILDDVIDLIGFQDPFGTPKCSILSLGVISNKPVPQIAVGQLNVAMVEAPGRHSSHMPSGWGWHPQHWQNLQGQNAVLRRISSYVEVGRFLLREERLAQPKDVQKLLGQWNQLCLKEGVLCSLRQDSATQERAVNESAKLLLDASREIVDAGVFTGRGELFVPPRIYQLPDLEASVDELAFLEERRHKSYDPGLSILPAAHKKSRPEGFELNRLYCVINLSLWK